MKHLPSTAVLRRLLTLVAVAWIACAPARAEQVEFERWYALLIQDKPAGWQHVQVVNDRRDGTISTIQAMEMTIRRANQVVRTSVSLTFTETTDGHPITARITQKTGLHEVRQTYIFRADHIELIVQQNDREVRRTVPLPEGQWLTPAAAQRYIREQIAIGADEIAYRTFDPLLGPKVFELKRVAAGERNIAVMGKTVPARVWRSTVSLVPGLVSTEYTDSEGALLRSSVDLGPQTKMTVVQADKQLAQARVNPPELLTASLIKPDRAIPAPRRARSAVFEITLKPRPFGDDPDDGAARLKLPTAGYQHTKWVNDHKAVVSVDIDDPLSPGADRPAAEHLLSSPMLDIDDPFIQDLLEQALADQPEGLSPAKKAELLRDFVDDYIEQKDLSVGFASASEVARTAQGDCTEHAVLLAAMLRAAGIPSRTVSGLVYVYQFAGHADVFGYHMWTQAWPDPKARTSAPALPIGRRGGGTATRPRSSGLSAGLDLNRALEEPGSEDGDDEKKPKVQGPRWVDLDATLGAVPFDATHIALSVSAMNDPAGVNDIVTLVPLFGRVSIRITSINNGRSAP